MRRRRVALVTAAIVVWGAAGVVVWRSPEATPRHHRTLRPAGSLTPSTGVGGQPASPVAEAAGGSRTARWVIDENAKPGTTDWHITNPPAPGHAPGIEGFADHVSAARGDAVNLYVSTNAASWRIDAYRMGYYGGTGARLVWRSPELQGMSQPVAVRDAATNMIEAPWQPSATVRPDTTWPPGDYLLKLVADDGSERYVPLTLRDDASTAAYLIMNAVTTWQAYNLWGGYDLYEGQTTSGASAFAHRSRVVSFDRPYAFGDGAADFLGNEFPLVSLAESLGLDVSYWTDVDLHRHNELLTHHRALLSLGHDEYWSANMRDGAEQARDQGVNIAFFGANAVYRHIRFEDSALGSERHEVDYKSAREDPMYGFDNSDVTVDWRDPPVSRPESVLVGDYYECNPVKADMVVADPSAWVFEGTGLEQGSTLPEIVGPEYDRYDRQAPGPDDVQVLAHSPLRCRGSASYSDMTYYTAGSGAGVFATGTNWWISHLVAPCPGGGCHHDDQAVRITENVLAAFGAGPAGVAHPSVPNYQSLPEVTLPRYGRHATTTTTLNERVEEPGESGAPPPSIAPATTTRSTTRWTTTTTTRGGSAAHHRGQSSARTPPAGRAPRSR